MQEILDAPKSAVVQYEPFYAQLIQLEQENSKLVFNYSDKKGNKEARSHVFSLRKTKSALETTRKDAKSESLRIGRAIDLEASEISLRIEAMIKIHQDEIDRIENIEKERIAKITAKLDVIKFVHNDKTAAEYHYHLQTLESVVIDDKWEEFITEAAKAKDASIAKHRALLADREKSDIEAAELLRLRKEAEDRAIKDREEAIAKAASDKAKAEAEQQAIAAAAKAKQDIAEAESKAAQERESFARRELALKLEAEQAENRALQAKQKAEQDRIEALEKAEKEKQSAINAEKARIVKEKLDEEAEQAIRESNKKHCANINNEALKALVSGGIDEDVAKQCIKLIAKGNIPSMHIVY